MKDLKEINKILKDHERRLAILEKIKAELVKRLDGHAANDNVIKVGYKKKKIIKSLSDHIIELRDRGTFKEALTAKEVHKKIGVTYPCELNRVEVELSRLQKRKQLRKTSKLIEDKKYGAYVWQITKS